MVDAALAECIQTLDMSHGMHRNLHIYTVVQQGSELVPRQSNRTCMLLTLLLDDTVLYTI